MHINHKSSILIFSIAAFLPLSLIAQEPETLREKAARNATPKSKIFESSEESNKYTYGKNINIAEDDLGNGDPVLIKVLIPYDESSAIATIQNNASKAPYRVGDHLPPHYKITSIRSNVVSLKCTNTDNKDKCKSRLYFSGLSSK